MASVFLVEKLKRKGDKYGKKSEPVEKDFEEGNLLRDHRPLPPGIRGAETEGHGGKYSGILQYRAGGTGLQGHPCQQREGVCPLVEQRPVLGI